MRTAGPTAVRTWRRPRGGGAPEWGAAEAPMGGGRRRRWRPAGVRRRGGRRGRWRSRPGHPEQRPIGGGAVPTWTAPRCRCVSLRRRSSPRRCGANGLTSARPDAARGLRRPAHAGRRRSPGLRRGCGHPSCGWPRTAVTLPASRFTRQAVSVRRSATRSATTGSPGCSQTAPRSSCRAAPHLVSADRLRPTARRRPGHPVRSTRTSPPGSRRASRPTTTSTTSSCSRSPAASAGRSTRRCAPPPLGRTPGPTTARRTARPRPDRLCSTR